MRLPCSSIVHGEVHRRHQAPRGAVCAQARRGQRASQVRCLREKNSPPGNDTPGNDRRMYLRSIDMRIHKALFPLSSPLCSSLPLSLDLFNPSPRQCLSSDDTQCAVRIADAQRAGSGPWQRAGLHSGGDSQAQGEPDHGASFVLVPTLICCALYRFLWLSGLVWSLKSVCTGGLPLCRCIPLFPFMRMISWCFLCCKRRISAPLYAVLTLHSLARRRRTGSATKVALPVCSGSAVTFFFAQGSPSCHLFSAAVLSVTALPFFSFFLFLLLPISCFLRTFRLSLLQDLRRTRYCHAIQTCTRALSIIFFLGSLAFTQCANIPHRFYLQQTILFPMYFVLLEYLDHCGTKKEKERFVIFLSFFFFSLSFAPKTEDAAVLGLVL